MDPNGQAPMVDAGRPLRGLLGDSPPPAPRPRPGVGPAAAMQGEDAADGMGGNEEVLRQRERQREEALREAQAHRLRYQELFDFAPDGYLVTDLHGTIQEANRAAAALLNIMPHRLPGVPLVVFIASEARQPFRAQMA